MVTIADLKKEAEANVLYEKDKETKIATITFNRLEKHNTANIGMRARFGELVFKANIDDDVKVLVIRGAGDHLGSGGDLDEHGDLYLSPKEGDNFLVDLEIDDPDVKYPPPGPTPFSRVPSAKRRQDSILVALSFPSSFT